MPRKENLLGDQNQCPTCGEYFTTTRNFDLHRRGVWRDRKWLYPGSIGMEKNVEEFWHRVVSDRKHPHGTTSVIQEGT